MVKLRDAAALAAISLFAIAPALAQQNGGAQPPMMQQGGGPNPGVAGPPAGMNSTNGGPQATMPGGNMAPGNTAQGNMPQEGPNNGMAMNNGISMNLSSLSKSSVKELQEALQANGLYQKGRVDGMAGPGTRHALQQFEQQHGMQSSGTLNEQTLAALGLRTTGNGQIEEAKGEKPGAMNVPNGMRNEPSGQGQMGTTANGTPGSVGMTPGPGSNESAMQNMNSRTMPPNGVNNQTANGPNPGMAANGPAGTNENSMGSNANGAPVGNSTGAGGGR